MKLRYSAASPFVRKVIVVALERGLNDRLEHIDTDPFSEDSDLRVDNPLSKIPTLELDDGRVLIESSLICEYLDGLHDGAKLIPEGDARMEVLKRQALVDGMTTAGVLLRIETQRRPPEFMWQAMVERQKKTMFGVLGMLEADADSLSTSDDLNIADIALGCSLGWIDFRFADLGWRQDHPAVADWFENFSNRPSMIETAPS